MEFRGMEDRLNPIAPPGVDETTLGGYAAVHGRSPGFEGPDGCAYTVAIEAEAIEAEAVEGEEESWAAYLVFLRWADQGSAIMGHVETEDLATGSTAEEARKALEELPLARIKEILSEAVERKRHWGDEG